MADFYELEGIEEYDKDGNLCFFCKNLQKCHKHNREGYKIDFSRMYRGGKNKYNTKNFNDWDK